MSDPPRLVMVLYPFQGHISPMLQLATILHSKGFSITIVHTQFNSPNPSNHPHFYFVSIPDDLSKSNLPPGDFVASIMAINRNCEAPFQKFMKQTLEQDDPCKKIAAVLFDGFMHFAQKVSSQLDLPCICVRTSAAAALLMYKVFRRTDQEGYTTFQDSLSPDHVSKLLPNGLTDMLTSIAPPNPSDALLQLRATVSDAVRNSSAIIVNTIDFLETETLVTLKEHFPPTIFPIGPFHKIAPSSSSSLLKEDHECLSWLDKQAHRSVLYVSFGSMAVMNEEELIEIAEGLNSKRKTPSSILKLS